MRICRSIRGTAVLVLGGVMACSGGADPDDDGSSPQPSPVAAVRITQGDAQTDVVGALLPLRLVVQAVDGTGAPVAGVTLAFTVAAGSGTVTAPRATTNAEGLASVQWRLGTRAGAQTLAVNIAVSGDTVTLAQATATATPGPAVALALADTSLRYLDPGTTTPLVLNAVDAYGNTAPTTGVTWSTNAPAVLAIASDGRASALQPGRAEVEARLGALAITRSLLVRPVAAENFALHGVIGLVGAAGRLLVSGWFRLTEWDGSGWRGTGIDNTVGFQGIFSVPAIGSDGAACVALAREPYVDRGIACSPVAGAPFVVGGGTTGYIDDLAILEGDRLVALDAINYDRRPDGTYSTRVVVERREQGAWRDLALPATWPGDSMPWGGGSIAAVGDQVWYGDAVGVAATNRRARPLLVHHDGTAWAEIALDGTGGTWVSVERGTGGAVAALVHGGDSPRVFRVQGRTATPVPISLQILRGASGLAVSPSGRLALITPDGVAWETSAGWAEYPFSSGERGVEHNVWGPPAIAWSDEGTLWVATSRGEFDAAIVKRLRP